MTRGAFFLIALSAVPLTAQTLTTLASFNNAFGSTPSAGVIQGIDGDFYGTASAGGANNYCGTTPPDGCGTVYKIDASRNVTTLHSFCENGLPCLDGSAPNGVIQTPNGDVYGTTVDGGNCVGFPQGCGTVFRITPKGAFTTLHNFCSPGGACFDGFAPNGNLLRAVKGDFYGTTYAGGAHGAGTVFQITTGGVLTTIHSFCERGGKCPDGQSPRAGLVEGPSGILYGTTYAGGAYGFGSVFSITPTGRLTVLHSFCANGYANGCLDGDQPMGQLVQSANGTFYGTTVGGGAITCYVLNGCGTAFSITPDGRFTTLYQFCASGIYECPDGSQPSPNLTIGTDGAIYGTTSYGGTQRQGTIFKISPGNQLVTLYTFCSQNSPNESCTDGANPNSLMEATDGSFYGTTAYGGDSNYGTIFNLAVGLAPFISPQVTSGQIGAAVPILGTNLSGVTSVSFNGIPAPFGIFSSSLVATRVPDGATSGTIQMVTSTGTLLSNVPFQVLR